MRVWRVTALLLCLVLLVSGCTPKAESPAPTQTVQLKLCAYVAYEEAANVLRDQLKKIGIDLVVDIFPDTGTTTKAQESGEYDLYIGDITGSGSPDSAYRALLTVDGKYAKFGVNNPELEELMDLAATQTPEVYKDTYKQIEQLICEEEVYTTVLYRIMYYYAFSNVIDETSLWAPGVYRSFQHIDYVDPSLRETRPYTTAIALPNPFSFDTLRGSDGSTYLTTQNVNIRLLRADADRNPTTSGALSKAYAVAEGNDTFYFLLRDNIRYGRIVDGQAVDTGVRVSAEDVMYSFDRMRDIIPTPTNMATSYVDQISDMAIVTDLSELENTKLSGSSKSILEALNDGNDQPLVELASGRDDVDGSKGRFQVVKIETAAPFPQFVANLSATQVGIVNKDIVSEANKGITPDNYDPATMVMYGDPATLRKSSPEFNNNMYFSGPYCITYIDDYGIYLQANPGFAPGTDAAPKIKNVTIRVIPDATAQYNAFRNGEVDEFQASAANIADLKANPNVKIVSTGRLNCVALYYFVKGDSKCADPNLRKAIKWAINQGDYIAVLGNLHKPAGSLYVMVDTGYLPKQDPTKAQTYMDEYLKTLK